MNYYEHHLGDYLRDAGHLSMLEEGAYRRLIDAYYIRERGLPGDLRECCKLAKATTKAERDAVAYVLREFFVLAEGLYTHGRCEKEIAKYIDGEPQREAKKIAERDRQRRAREERQRLFAELRERGIVPAYDTTTTELRRILGQPVTRDIRRTSEVRGCDVTATHSPDTSKEQDQEQFQASWQELTTPAPDSGPPASLPRVTPPAIPTDAGLACRLMRDAGCTQTNPGHPDLLAALAEGCTPAELAATAAEAIAAGIRKPFPWAIATTRGRRAEGPKPAPAGASRHDPDHRSGSRRPSLIERVTANARRVVAADRLANGDPVGPDDGDLRPPLDGTARRIG